MCDEELWPVEQFDTPAYRDRFLALLRKYEIPEHVHAATLVWLDAWQGNWESAERVAAEAATRWREYQAGRRRYWL
jgi:hypothetical protein